MKSYRFSLFDTLIILRFPRSKSGFSDCRLEGLTTPPIDS